MIEKGVCPLAVTQICMIRIMGSMTLMSVRSIGPPNLNATNILS